jgi:hypothetical protein
LFIVGKSFACHHNIRRAEKIVKETKQGKAQIPKNLGAEYTTILILKFPSKFQSSAEYIFEERNHSGFGSSDNDKGANKFGRRFQMFDENCGIIYSFHHTLYYIYLLQRTTFVFFCFTFCPLCINW